jgi:hypothetical protein
VESTESGDGEVERFLGVESTKSGKGKVQRCKKKKRERPRVHASN